MIPGLSPGCKQRFPAWLCPRLSTHVPEPFAIARARLAGYARARALSPEALRAIGRRAGAASYAKASAAQRRAWAQAGAAAVNAKRWGAR